MLFSIVDPTLTKEVLEHLGRTISLGDIELIINKAIISLLDSGELHKVVVDYIVDYVKEVLSRRSELM